MYDYMYIMYNTYIYIYIYICIDTYIHSSGQDETAGMPTAQLGATIALGLPTGNDLGVGDDYHGFRLELPLTLAGAGALMQHYLKTGDSEPIHPKYVNYLTTTFTNLYVQRHPKPVVRTDIPKPGRVIVVGDTHGQLQDLLHIMHTMGSPSQENKYIFNGDMCDRGDFAVEILLILFSFFIADPECIVIHRGNHENEDSVAPDSFHPFGQFCETYVSLLSLQKRSKAASNILLFRKGG